MKTLTNLSENAQKLYAFLKENGAKAEDYCIYALFPKPDFNLKDKEKLRQYWKWDANLYGVGGVVSRSMGDGTFEDFTHPNEYADTYGAQTSKAYQELRKAGLAGESNGGFNNYTFYLI